ncbi:unnamed protein product [Phytophthora fragariaefolia]|uniref:Unnamed protein product n=1 Tax=Phytophthora fragariaefolia TaxID=1490495 RepID=A0A9W7CZ15_9STRA|nr:unnamed protein product [Phytophthora fragariaefolia]
MILDISSGESRGYWKYHVPDKKFKQAKAVGKINNAKATLLFDSGDEVSILDTAFARQVGCYVDNSQTLQCEGVGKSPYMAEGRTRLKITLAGSLVYFFNASMGPPTGGQDLILGMDFMQGEVQGPTVEWPQYQTPTSILKQPSTCPVGTAAARWFGRFFREHKQIPADDATSTHSAPVDLGDSAVDPGDEEVCIRESGDLYAEDVQGHLAVLPEVTPTTEEVKIEDIQVGNPNDNTQEQVDQLKKVAPRFREKLFQLIKGLLSAKVIQHSTSPWASPIVVIIKKNGIDIRLCIDYRLFNSLTRLMVYPMPLINDLLDDLDKALWYCLLDMASGFGVVSMTDRARAISAFITPSGLFEWNHHQVRNAGDQDRQRPIDLFQDGEPGTDKESSVLGRRSYIDDILVTAGSWDMLCERVDKLLDACDEWNLSISVAKSFWGLKKVDYLGHRIPAGGMEARPKDLSSLVDLPFPTSLRSMQSFLGSLNYYSRFIEEFAIYASILYELREIDFFEASGQAKARLESNDQNQRDRWARATKAFVVLKEKIVNAPILTHFDPDKRPVVILQRGNLSCSRARTRGIIALLRVLDVCYTQLVTRSIKVLTRHSTLARMLNSSGLQGRLGRWAALLSNWTLEMVKCTKGEDEILGVIAASITPREDVDSILTSIAPRKQPRQVISMPPPTVGSEEELLVVSFDGSARVKRGGGAFRAIVWSLPDWTVISGANLTVNEAEYHGLLLCFERLAKQHVDHNRLIICGDSNLVIRQMRGEIECKAPSLKLLRQKAMEMLRSWPKHEFLHVKRDWNQSADKLASAALQREAGEQVTSQTDIDDLATRNRLAELSVPQSQISVVKIAATTRSRQRRDWEVLQEPLVQSMRMERMGRAQDEEKWIVDLKKYLPGDVRELTSTEAKSCAKIAENYEIEEVG